VLSTAKQMNEPNDMGADFSFFFLGQRTNSLPSPFLPSPPLPSFLIPLLSPSFRSSLLNTARGSGERCKLFPSGLGRSPSRQTIYLHLSLPCVILTDFSTGSPVHVLMLSIQAVRGLPRLRAPGIVPCIISFSGQLPCFLMVRL